MVFCRYGRNAHFLLGLKEAGVKFLAADNPSANNLTIGILSLIAEHEHEAISDRVKRALAAAKARGTKLGGYRGYSGNTDDLVKARVARTNNANQKAKDYELLFDRLNPDGTVTMKDMAELLNAEAVPTPSGRGHWQGVQVKRIYNRFAA